jgi:hypothetical protein
VVVVPVALPLDKVADQVAAEATISRELQDIQEHPVKVIMVELAQVPAVEVAVQEQ